MSDNKGFIEVSLDIDDIYLKIQRGAEEEIFECMITENELDWCIDALQKYQKNSKKKEKPRNGYF